VLTISFFSFFFIPFSCLNDAELSFLGAPWPRYYEAATKHNIEIIRLPMLEGSCPHSIEEVDAVVDLVVKKMTRGENVLTHCRGGKQRTLCLFKPLKFFCAHQWLS
jgi:hypothetical protein